MRTRKVHNFNYLEHYTHFVPGWSQLLILLIWMIVGVLLGNVVSALFSRFLGAEAGLKYGLILSYPSMFIPAMIYAGTSSSRRSFLEEGVPVDSSNFAPKGGLLCSLVVLFSTLCLSFCADSLTNLLPPMPDKIKDLLDSMLDGELWVNFLCVSIFAPIFEEWLCRGMVLRGLLSHKVKPLTAVVISAVFFAVLHLNPWQAVPAFLMGLLFGFVYYRTGSLKLTMLMHFTNNTFALFMSRIPAFEDMETWRDVFQGPQYWALLAACTFAVCLSVLFFNKINRNSQWPS